VPLSQPFLVPDLWWFSLQVFRKVFFQRLFCLYQQPFVVAIVLLMGQIIHLIHSQWFSGSGSPLASVSSWFMAFVWVPPHPFSFDPLFSLPFGSRAVKTLPCNFIPICLENIYISNGIIDNNFLFFRHQNHLTSHLTFAKM
jgi:hypothetical protein